MKPDYEEDYSYILLEWQENIPAMFQKSTVSLAEGLEAQVIPLLPAGDSDENLSQPGLVSQPQRWHMAQPQGCLSLFLY